MASASPRLLVLPLLTALALGATPTLSATPAAEASASAAPASRWALPPANLTKRSALLGGPSHMERLLLEQGAPVRTASLAGFVPAPAAGAAYVPAQPSFTEARSTDAASPNGAPNVFGSTALAVESTPLDGQWRRANAAPARHLVGFTAEFEPAAGREAMLRQVNDWVNSRITFTDDFRISGEADRWAGAAETLRRGRGDCEDYALAKMQLLEALGFDPERMYLVVARDLQRRADHAVLVVQLGNRFVVLDNLTDRIVDSRAIHDYRPIMSYSAGRRWVHGYAATPQPMQIAATLSGQLPGAVPSAP